MKYYIVSDKKNFYEAVTDPAKTVFSNETLMLEAIEDGQYLYELHVAQPYQAKVERTVTLIRP